MREQMEAFFNRLSKTEKYVAAAAATCWLLGLFIPGLLGTAMASVGGFTLGYLYAEGLT